MPVSNPSNYFVSSVPENARTRTAFRSSTCICCGTAIVAGDHTIKQVKTTNSSTGAVKTKWVHETCADAFDFGKTEPTPAVAPVEPVAVEPAPVVKEQPADTDQALQLLSQLLAPKQQTIDLEALNENVKSMVASATMASCDLLIEKCNELEKTVAEMQPKIIKIKVGERKEVALPKGEIVHPIFKDALTLAEARKNIMFVGPTGSGKTHLAGQIADALELKFRFISCSGGMSEGQLLGRLLPVGEGGSFEYVQSDFVDCYENGGVFAFDEFDAADANVLLVVNAALANGRLALPNRTDKPVAEKHKDFICVACANTFGTGADRKYVGRSRLDEATIERFRIGTLFMDYDAELEKTLCPCEKLRTELSKFRTAVVDQRVERVVSTRFMRDAYEMQQMGWKQAQINEALFSGWKASEVDLVKNYARDLSA